MLKHWLTLSLVTFACAACTNVRPPTGTEACLDYAQEIQPVLNAACLECHGPTLAKGDYSVEDRATTFAQRSDGTPRITARADALLLQAARGELQDHPAAAADDLALLERWLVDCQANTLRNDAVHPRGWLNRDSEEFHGRAIRDAGWDFAACGECHGDPDAGSGGDTGIACTRCHTEGATACFTCHGLAASGGAPAPALDGSRDTTSRGVGAHSIHLNGRLLSASVACEDCHVVPESWDDPGHILLVDGTIDEAPAEVTFGARAGRSLEDLEERRTAEPSYDHATGTCSNVYCHAAVVGDTTYEAPVWTEISDEPACNTCHGLPPGGTHLDGTNVDDCARCHPLVFGAQTGTNTFEILDDSLHGDGRLSLGDGDESCAGCHGSANPAPPTGVNGEASTSDPQVGAHQAHVVAGTFRGPMACGDCHVAPTGESFVDAVIATGHIDTVLPAEVFPAGFGGVGGADNAAATYARPNCTNTYCHGGGDRGSLDMAPGIVRTLDWTDVNAGTVMCGSCHGLPPDTPTHWQDFLGSPITVNDCYLCHPEAIDNTGSLIFDASGNSMHINGRIGR